MIFRSISRNAIILGAFALGTVAITAVTNLLTHEDIQINRQQVLINTIETLVEQDAYNNDLFNDCVLISAPQVGASAKHPVKAYLARQDDTPVAAFIQSIAPDGYSGAIRLTVGIYYDGNLAGVRVNEHKETPGLGDKVELKKSNWLLAFDGKSLSNPAPEKWKVKKDGGDFDQLTGATITPRAVVKSVSNTLNYFTGNKEQLFSATTGCHDE
jgi:electron transport complex protein RnfG